MPDTAFPPESRFDVRAVYRPVLQEDRYGVGHPEIQVPTTDTEVTIFEMTSRPAAVGERYARSGERFWRYAPGTESVEVSARGRIYGRVRQGAPWFRPIRQLFVGARIEHVEERSP